MLFLLLFLLAGAAIETPIYLWLCGRLGIFTFWRAAGVGLLFYVVNALVIAAVFAFLDAGNISEAILATGFFALYGLVMFALPFAIVVAGLAYWVQRRAESRPE